MCCRRRDVPLHSDNTDLRLNRTSPEVYPRKQSLVLPREPRGVLIIESKRNNKVMCAIVVLTWPPRYDVIPTEMLRRSLDQGVLPSRVSFVLNRCYKFLLKLVISLSLLS